MTPTFTSADTEATIVSRAQNTIFASLHRSAIWPEYIRGVRIHKKKASYSVALNAFGNFSYVGTAATLHEAANAAFARLRKDVEYMKNTPDNIAKATANIHRYDTRHLATINEYSFFVKR